MDKQILDILKGVDKMNPDGDFLDQNTLSNVTEWIDTGSYALNAIISGSLFKGIPVGRIIGLAGPSGSGKTLMINKIIANYQNMVKDGIAVIWDSEVAADKTAAENVGADSSRIKYYPVNSIENTRNQISKLLDLIIEKNMQGKFLIAIDSLGNLASEKELADAEKDKTASDQGLRAKALKSMLRVLTYKAAKAKTTIVFSNHTYEDPGAMYPSMIKNQSGGKGPTYLASVLVQFGVKQDKEKEEEENDNKIIPIANKVSGVTLSAMTVKNRFIPPFLKTELSLNFKTGLDKKSGLIDMAQAYGIIKPSGPVWTTSDGNSIGYRKDWENNNNFWDKVIIPQLEKTLQETLGYSSEQLVNDDTDDAEESTISDGQ